jgi:predicted RNA binding protein YcfA (HicA-like mRNA interferase family)
MRAREVEKVIRQKGGVHTRTVGSHKRFQITGNGITASNAVPQHPGDIPTGTLRKIDRDLAPALGKGWLV